MLINHKLINKLESGWASGIKVCVPRPNNIYTVFLLYLSYYANILYFCRDLTMNTINYTLRQYSQSTLNHASLFILVTNKPTSFENYKQS